MNNLNITSNKKQVINVKDILQNNPNAKIIILDPEKDYEKLVKIMKDFPCLKL